MGAFLEVLFREVRMLLELFRRSRALSKLSTRTKVLMIGALALATAISIGFAGVSRAATVSETSTEIGRAHV